MAMAAVYTDAMERCYCDKHRRELCHECCLAFGDVNRMREVECGARQAPSQAMELAKTKVILERGIAYLSKQPPSKAFRSNMAYHKAEMKKVDAKLAKLRRDGKSDEVCALRSCELLCVSRMYMSVFVVARVPFHLSRASVPVPAHKNRHTDIDPHTRTLTLCALANDPSDSECLYIGGRSTSTETR